MNKKVIILGALLLTLTGCTNKSDILKCTQENEVITVEFDKDIPKIMKSVTTEKSGSKEELESNKANLEELKKVYEEIKGFKFAYTEKDLELAVTITINLNELSDEYKENLDYKTTSKEDVIKSLEDDGYKCK